MFIRKPFTMCFVGDIYLCIILYLSFWTISLTGYCKTKSFFLIKLQGLICIWTLAETIHRSVYGLWKWVQSQDSNLLGSGYLSAGYTMSDVKIDNIFRISPLYTDCKWFTRMKGEGHKASCSGRRVAAQDSSVDLKHQQPRVSRVEPEDKTRKVEQSSWRLCSIVGTHFSHLLFTWCRDVSLIHPNNLDKTSKKLVYLSCIIP